MSDTPRTDAILALLPGGQSCDPQAVADDLRPEIARLERELEQERQLVASLQALATTDHESKEAFIRRCREALGISEPARFWVPGESCPECGNDLSVRDHGDGRVYDGEECRCCECAFTGYLSVDEDGQTLVHDYQADEAVNPP